MENITTATHFTVYNYIKKSNKLQYWGVRYKDDLGVWKMKQAPVQYQSEEDVKGWFEGVLQSVKRSELPTMESIVGSYVSYLKTGKDTRKYSNANGHLEHHIKGSKMSIKPFDQLGPNDVNSFFSGLKGKRKPELAPFTRRNILQTLRDAVKYARSVSILSWDTKNVFNDAEDLIKIVPDGVKVEKLAGEENVIALESSIIRDLLTNESLKKNNPERWIRYWIASMGYRDGELCVLQWGDIDFTAKTIVIRRSMSREKVIRILKPKAKSFRTNPIPTKLVPVLEWWRDVGYEAFTGMKPGQKSYVLPDALGNIYTPKASSNLRRDLKNAGLPTEMQGLGDDSFPYTFHSFRRSTSTILSNKHVEDAIRGRLLGHQKKGVTDKAYTNRQDPEPLRPIVELLDCFPTVSL